jgi:hypothetical protein
LTIKKGTLGCPGKNEMLSSFIPALPNVFRSFAKNSNLQLFRGLLPFLRAKAQLLFDIPPFGFGVTIRFMDNPFHGFHWRIALRQYSLGILTKWVN